MGFETIRKSHKKSIVIGAIIFIILAIVLVVRLTFAKYNLVKSIKIAEGTINYKVPDFKIMAMYKNDGSGYTEIDTMPESGYVINETKSYCELNGSKDTKAKLFTNEDGKHVISGLSKGSKCYLYFDYVDKEKPVISNVTINGTKTEINVTVTATDNKGVTEYYYSIDNGTYVKTTTRTYKFTGLTAGSAHAIKVYVKDAAGNESEVVSKTGTTTIPTASETILGNVTVKNGTPNFSKTSCATGTNNGSNCLESNSGVYKANDNDGISYYFRGSVTNNYVKFANKYWRIIRINGDGSIRLIYDGTSAHANGTSTSDSIIVNHSFNSNYINNSLVGFKYTNGEVHGLGTKSYILTELETWYTSNLSNYANKIDTNAGFCGDRTPSTSEFTSNGLGGTELTTTYYGAFIRLYTNKSPVLTCPNASDLYTVSSSTKGNKSLTYPIGLITADEVSMAGGLRNNDNYGYYLYNGQPYWTLSPSSFSQSVRGSIFTVADVGYLFHRDVNVAAGVRPVINLKYNVTLTGNGTMSDPYVVS